MTANFNLFGEHRYVCIVKIVNLQEYSIFETYLSNPTTKVFDTYLFVGT